LPKVLPKKYAIQRIPSAARQTSGAVKTAFQKMKMLLSRKNQKTPFATEKPMPSLLACLLMDLLGYATYGIPVLGEFLDIAWAPISAFIFFRMFGGSKGFFGGIFNFVEELMPGLDFIPTFTITWVVQYFQRRKGSVITRPFPR
jgi:hypothetical protein